MKLMYFIFMANMRSMWWKRGWWILYDVVAMDGEEVKKK